MRPIAIKLLGGLVLVALLLAPAAAAHEDESPPGYESKVLSVSPAMDGIEAVVVEGDDELELVNGTGKTVVIFGYNKEPYLRFAGNGVFENQRSPAAFLNDDRFGTSKVPKDVSAKASPLWLKVASGDSFSWHDHRIHWMSPIDPPKVRADKGSSHHIFDWKVQAAVGGEPLTIAGTLDYSPPGGGGVSTGLIAAIGGGAAAVLAAGAVLFLRRRRSA